MPPGSFPGEGRLWVGCRRISLRAQASPQQARQMNVEPGLRIYGQTRYAVRMPEDFDMNSRNGVWRADDQQKALLMLPLSSRVTSIHGTDVALR